MSKMTSAEKLARDRFKVSWMLFNQEVPQATIARIIGISPSSVRLYLQFSSYDEYQDHNVRAYNKRMNRNFPEPKQETKQESPHYGDNLLTCRGYLDDVADSTSRTLSYLSTMRDLLDQIIESGEQNENKS